MGIVAEFVQWWRGRQRHREHLTLTGRYRVQLHDAKTGELVSDRWYDNTVCTVGKNYVMSLLNNEVLASATVWGAVGTSGTAPAAGDTQLGAEVSRVTLAVQSRGGSVLTWSFFWTTAQANATLAEAGIFLGGSSSANSGSILSHVLISDTKTSAHTMTVQFQLTLS